MSDVTRVVATEGTEEALIEKARQYREQEPSFLERERAGAIEATRRQAQSMGTHRADARGHFRTEHPISFTVDETVAADAIRIGGNVMKRSVAESVGLVDGAGNLTQKGKAASRGDDPAAAARPAAQPSRVPAEELAARQGEDFEDDDDTEDDTERADTELDYTGSDTSDAVDSMIASGDFNAVVDSAAEALGTLDHSEAYSQARDRYLAGENVSRESLAAIGEELGISKVQAAQLVDRVFDGHRAEAARAVSGILSPSESASFAAFIVDQPERFGRAAELHAKRGSTIGWINEARAFKQAISSIGNPSDYLGTHRGGTVEKQGDRYVLSRPGHAPVDLLVAVASGLVRPR